MFKEIAKNSSASTICRILNNPPIRFKVFFKKAIAL